MCFQPNDIQNLSKADEMKVEETVINYTDEDANFNPFIKKRVEDESVSEEESERELEEDELFFYECPECCALFHNVNNYQLHRSMHVDLPIHLPAGAAAADAAATASSSQKLSWEPGYQDPKGRPYYDFAFYTCAEIVDELVDSLNILA